MTGPEPAVEHPLPYTVKIDVRPSLTGQTFYATIYRVEEGFKFRWC